MNLLLGSFKDGQSIQEVIISEKKLWKYRVCVKNKEDDFKQIVNDSELKVIDDDALDEKKFDQTVQNQNFSSLLLPAAQRPRYSLRLFTFYHPDGLPPHSQEVIKGQRRTLRLA